MGDRGRSGSDEQAQRARSRSRAKSRTSSTGPSRPGGPGIKRSPFPPSMGFDPARDKKTDQPEIPKRFDLPPEAFMQVRCVKLVRL